MIDQPKISQAAFDLTVAAEISDKATYDKVYCRPEWPGGASGVTIGVGFDVGYCTEKQLRDAWIGKIPEGMIAALARYCGVHGDAAKDPAHNLRSIVNVPWQAALDVFSNRDIPQWTGRIILDMPNAALLDPDCLGALVSLAYNRGMSFDVAKEHDPSGRYTEMRAIKSHISAKEYVKIPAEFRSMRRLWPNMRGLRFRRENEAQLFERGLATMNKAGA